MVWLSPSESAANGVEFTVVLLSRRDRTELGSDFGLFTAVTSAPYVLVPALATLLLARDARAGVLFLFTLAGALAVVAALTVAGAVRVQSHRDYRSRAPH